MEKKKRTGSKNIEPCINLMHSKYVVRVANKTRSFGTLEEAREYRNAMKAAMIRSDLNGVIRDLEKNGYAYPYNIIEQFVPKEQLSVDYDWIVENFETNWNKVIEILSPREKSIIECRFHYLYTLEKTGAMFNVTRERIRQIEHVALHKIKHRTEFLWNPYKTEVVSLRKEYEQLLAMYRDSIEEVKEIAERYEEENGIVEPSYYWEKMSISELYLSVRSYNCLRRAGILTVAELISHTEKEISKIRNLGKKCIKELREKLADYGLSFAE